MTPAYWKLWNRVGRKIDRSDPDGCWPWAGYFDGYGYGQTKIGGRSGHCKAVHRLIWELVHEVELAPTQVVCHHCDNPPCANPGHLFVARRADNSADMVLKGRHFNQLKTHCPAGHQLGGDNLVWNRTAGRKPHRVCATCSRAAKRHYKAKQKAAA